MLARLVSRLAAPSRRRIGRIGRRSRLPRQNERRSYHPGWPHGGYAAPAMGGAMAAPYPVTRATTIISVRKDGDVVVVGDGQVSFGDMVLKPNANKVRVIDSGRVITGFAGATADCLALLDRLETRLESRPGQLLRAAVEMSKGWRTDRYLRHLSATLIVVDAEVSLTLTGNGDVVEPQDGVIGIGSGGPFAVAAARALMDTDMSARDIAEKAMRIAADTCVYTNHNTVVQMIRKGEKLAATDLDKADTAEAEKSETEEKSS